MKSALPDARVQGSGRLSVWGFDVYDAALFVTPAFNADAFSRSPFALEMTYLRNFDGMDLAERSLDEIRRDKSMDPATARRWLEQLRRAMPNVRKGDRLAGIYRPGQSANFFHNGKPTAPLTDPELAERFFAIWLSAGTSEPDLRKALVGQRPAH